ncbi:conserved hypothetical protein, partial [Chlorobium ferrooxidans DSM 13031]
DDLAWAEPSPVISAAFARFAQVIEKHGAMALSTEVRNAVHAAVQNWNGSDPDMHNLWCEEAIANLTETDKSAGRLALLTALAPWRVDKTVVKAFSSSFPGDERLIAALAWSSFEAAKRTGSWL